MCSVFADCFVLCSCLYLHICAISTSICVSEVCSFTHTYCCFVCMYSKAPSCPSFRPSQVVVPIARSPWRGYLTIPDGEDGRLVPGFLYEARLTLTITGKTSVTPAHARAVPWQRAATPTPAPRRAGNGMGSGDPSSLRWCHFLEGSGAQSPATPPWVPLKRVAGFAQRPAVQGRRFAPERRVRTPRLRFPTHHQPRASRGGGGVAPQPPPSLPRRRCAGPRGPGRGRSRPPAVAFRVARAPAEAEGKEAELFAPRPHRGSGSAGSTGVAGEGPMGWPVAGSSVPLGLSEEIIPARRECGGEFLGGLGPSALGAYAGGGGCAAVSPPPPHMRPGPPPPICMAWPAGGWHRPGHPGAIHLGGDQVCASPSLPTITVCRPQRAAVCRRNGLALRKTGAACWWPAMV